MKLYIDSANCVRALHARGRGDLRKVETSLFDGWPDARILKYAVYLDIDGHVSGFYPYKTVDNDEAEVMRAAEQQASLQALGIASNEHLAGNAVAFAGVSSGSITGARNLKLDISNISSGKFKMEANYSGSSITVSKIWLTVA